MNDLIKKYNVDPVFFRRYFRWNANMNYSIRRRGKFLCPLKKTFLIEEITNKSIVDFYENGLLNIAKMDYIITCRCNLRCRDCSNYIPLFKGCKNDVTVNQFKKDIDVLTSVAQITSLHILGGEPLLHTALSEIISIAAKNQKIESVVVLTNGTLLPSHDLLALVQKYKDKVYFYISNYSANVHLTPLLRHDQIIESFKEHGVKFQRQKQLNWTKEEPLWYRGHSENQLKDQFADCITSSCLCVLDSKLHVCCKSAAAFSLNICNITDFIDLSAERVKQAIIDFYHKDYFQACKYCVRLSETVIPAIQMEEQYDDTQNIV
jgi:organic radical activating enzyme